MKKTIIFFVAVFLGAILISSCSQDSSLQELDHYEQQTNGRINGGGVTT